MKRVCTVSSSQHLNSYEFGLIITSLQHPLAVYEGKVGHEAVQVYWFFYSRCRALVGMTLLSSTVPVRDDVCYNQIDRIISFVRG